MRFEGLGVTPKLGPPQGTEPLLLHRTQACTSHLHTCTVPNPQEHPVEHPPQAEGPLIFLLFSGFWSISLSLTCHSVRSLCCICSLTLYTLQLHVTGVLAMDKKPMAEGLVAAAARGDLACIQMLLEGDVDVTWRDKDGMSALMRASDGGHVACVEALLEGGCPWNLQDHEGFTAGEVRTARLHLLHMAFQVRVTRPGLPHRRVCSGATSG